MGYQFMKEYYMIFDMSHRDDLGENQIGIAERNKTIDLGQIRYEPNFIDYLRANKSLDSSKIASGYIDQYDMEIKPSPDVNPTYPDDPDNPVDPKPENKDKGNGAWLAIGAAIIGIIILATVTVCCCCKKQQRGGSYVFKTYDKVPGESSEQLDKDNTLNN